MSQGVTNDILEAELARCKKVLSGLYSYVENRGRNNKDFYFIVGSPTDENLQGFCTDAMRIIYVAGKLKATRNDNQVEQDRNTAHLIIQHPKYQMSYEVHITFEEPLLTREESRALDHSPFFEN